MQQQTEYADSVAYCHKRKHVGLRMHYHTLSGCGSQRAWEYSAETRKCVFLMTVALACFCSSAV